MHVGPQDGFAILTFASTELRDAALQKPVVFSTGTKAITRPLQYACTDPIACHGCNHLGSQRINCSRSSRHQAFETNLILSLTPDISPS